MEKIKSKADAIVYAIEATKSKTGVDLKKANEVYELIVGKVQLPDAEKVAESELFGSLKGFFDGISEQMPHLCNCLSGMQPGQGGDDIKMYAIPRE